MKHIKINSAKVNNAKQNRIVVKKRREILKKQSKLKSLKKKLHWEGDLIKMRTDYHI